MKKKWLTGCVGMMFCVMVAAQKDISANFLGRWECIEADNTTSGLEFINVDSIFLFFNGEKKLAKQVSIDNTKNPLWFDFVIDDGTENLPVKSLLIFINKDLIKWQVFTNHARPAHFTQSAGDTMFLRRKKP